MDACLARLKVIEYVAGKTVEGRDDDLDVIRINELANAFVRLLYIFFN